MRSDPYITVSCDKCDASEEVSLTATARGYDERNVDTELARMGWTVGTGIDVCPDCSGSADE